jgi:hypothetical protein
MDNIVGRLQSLFPSHQFGVIIGSLLGDARLECRSAGLRNPVTARLRVHHGEKQKEYVFWKYKVLKNLVLKAPRKILWDNPKRNLHEISWYFHSRSLKEFGILYKYFYRENIKILPEGIFDLLTPQMLAVWFMDDGSNNKTGFTLNTHGFSREEELQIIEFLRKSYNIFATMVRDRTKFKIAIGANECSKLKTIIQPFIIPSMTYKIVNPRNDLVVLNGQS